MRINTPNRPKKEIKNTQTYPNEEIKKQLEQSAKKLYARIRRIEIKERTRRLDFKKR